MPRTPLPKPTDAELAILGVLWHAGPSTVRQVHDALARERGIGYTTILKLLQIMTDKGLVERDEAHRSHIYHARLPREQTQAQLVGDLLDKAFGGSAARLVMSALSHKPASREELAEIRKMLKKLDGGES
jgi:BlaI family transcriptional regulator, penicillinase repressor